MTARTLGSLVILRVDEDGGEVRVASHPALRFDVNAKRWKFHVTNVMDGWLRYRGGGKRISLEDIRASGHLKKDGDARVLTLHTHQLAGRFSVDGEKYRFYFVLPAGHVKPPPRHLLVRD